MQFSVLVVDYIMHLSFVFYCRWLLVVYGESLFDAVATRERRLVLRLAIAVATQQVLAGYFVFHFCYNITVQQLHVHCSLL